MMRLSPKDLLASDVARGRRALLPRLTEPNRSNHSRCAAIIVLQEPAEFLLALDLALTW